MYERALIKEGQRLGVLNEQQAARNSKMLQAVSVGKSAGQQAIDDAARIARTGLSNEQAVRTPYQAVRDWFASFTKPFRGEASGQTVMGVPGPKTLSRADWKRARRRWGGVSFGEGQGGLKGSKSKLVQSNEALPAAAEAPAALKKSSKISSSEQASPVVAPKTTAKAPAAKPASKLSQTNEAPPAAATEVAAAKPAEAVPASSKSPPAAKPAGKYANHTNQQLAQAYDSASGRERSQIAFVMQGRLKRAERAGGAEYAAMQQLFRSRLPTPKTAAAVEAASKAVPKAASAKPKPAVSQEQSAAVAAEPKPKPAAPVEPAAAVAAETPEQKKKALDEIGRAHV